MRLTGWALDPDTAEPRRRCTCTSTADGAAPYTASGNRPDIATAFPAYGTNHGFDTTVVIGAGNHQVCVYAINVGPTATNPLLGCRTVSGTPTGNFESVSRTGNSVRLTGWALDPDTANPVTVHVYVDGGWGGAYTGVGQPARHRDRVPRLRPESRVRHHRLDRERDPPDVRVRHQRRTRALNPLLGCRTA